MQGMIIWQNPRLFPIFFKIIILQALYALRRWHLIHTKFLRICRSLIICKKRLLRSHNNLVKNVLVTSLFYKLSMHCVEDTCFYKKCFFCHLIWNHSVYRACNIVTNERFSQVLRIERVYDTNISVNMFCYTFFQICGFSLQNIPHIKSGSYNQDFYVFNITGYICIFRNPMYVLASNVWNEKSAKYGSMKMLPSNIKTKIKLRLQTIMDFVVKG